MDLSEFSTALQQAFAPQLLNVLGAIGVMALGWLVAVAVRAGVRKGLGALKLDDRVQQSIDDSISLERPIASAFFWLIILMTIVGVFSVLNLTNVSAPIQAMVTQIIGYLPRIVAATLLLLVVWVIATVCKALATKLMSASSLDERLSKGAGMAPMSAHAATALFWLVILLFLPAVVGALGIAGLVGPLESLTGQFLDMLPNLFAAAVIAGVGWLLGRVLQGLVTSATSALGIDRHSGLLGVDREHALSRALGTVVFVLVLVPAIVAALDALRIEAISGPASAMLADFLAAIPNLLAAAVILVVAWILARVLASLVTRVTGSLGVDTWPEKLGFAPVPSGAARPSRLLGSLTLFFIMLFAATEAAGRLALSRLADLLAMFIQFAGDVLLGGVILVVGWWLAGLAHSAIRQASDRYGELLAQIARVAIIGLVLGMGLRAMGVADDIVNLGFGLTLGAVAFAIALAFGLGGREAAGQLLERWLGQIEESPRGTAPPKR